MRMRITLLGAVVASVTACGNDGSTISSEAHIDYAPCTQGTPTRVEADEETPAGTANELAVAVAGTRSAPLFWWFENGDPGHSEITVVTLEATADASSARTVPQQTVRPASPINCGTLLELDATLRLTTADGAFSERFHGTLEKDAVVGAVTFQGEMPADQHQGTYDLARRGIWNPSDVTLDVYSTLLPDLRGILSGEGPGAVGPTNTMGVFTLAFWPVSGSAGEGGVEPADGGG
jgi:hypothetical protein